jgi:hypothetical protein
MIGRCGVLFIMKRVQGSLFSGGIRRRWRDGAWQSYGIIDAHKHSGSGREIYFLAFARHDVNSAAR